MREAHALFVALVDLPPAEQAARLDEATPHDPALRAYVHELLQANRASFEALDTAEDGRTAFLAEALGDDGVPVRLGPYRVLRELGRGGMGVVYEAEHPTLERRVALKTLHPRQRSAAARDRFQAEVRAMARVLHPCIPQVYETFDVGDEPVLAMELVHGRPLLEAAADRPLDRRLEWLEQIARAVEHAHRRGIVHRDLKPANLLVSDPDELPKVLDFGIAALRDQDAPAGGTLAYVAPEQLSAGRADVRSDVFGLGAVGFALVTGRPPGAGATSDGSSVGPPELPRTVPRPVAAVLAKALAFEPADRYPTAGAFADDVRRIREDYPVEPLRGSWSAQATAAARRHRRLLWVGALSGLGVVASTALADAALRAWRAHVAETDAAEALRVVQTAPPAQRAEAFRAFADDPASAQTHALGEGWLWWASTSGGDDLEPWASAWRHARSDHVEADALRGLADGAARRRRWTAVRAVVSALGERASSPLVLRAALAGWDWEVAAAAAEPADRFLFTPLLHGRADAVRLPDGEIGPDGHRWRVTGDGLTRRAPEGTVARTWSLPRDARSGAALGWSGDQLWLLGNDDGLLARLDPGAAAVEVVDRVAVSWALAVEPWGDGMFLSTSPQHGALLLHRPGTAPVPFAPGIAEAGSSAQRVEVADLDGDGRPELVAMIAGWQLHDVRVWSEATAGWSRYRALPRWLDVLDTPDGPRIVAVVQPSDRLPVPPPDREEADRALVVLGWSPGGLVELSRTWLDFRATRVAAADLDGDGVDEVVVSRHEYDMALARMDGDVPGPLHRIPGLWLHRAGQLDDDPADELWVLERRDRSFVLGVDDGQPVRPPAAAELPVPEPVPPGATAPAARSWTRIEELAALGLVPEAAEQHARLAGTDPALATAGLDRGLTLMAGFRHRPDELEDARHREIALSLARQRAARPGPRSPEADAVLDREHAFGALPVGAGDASVTVRAPGVFHDAWRVLAPEAVAWDPGGDRLAIDLHPGDGDALALALAPRRPYVDVELVLDTIEHGFGGDLVVSLHDGDEVAALRLGVGGGGPPASWTEALACGSLDETVRRGRRSARGGRRRVRLSWRDRGDHGELRCRVDDAATTALTARPSGGPVTIRLGRAGLPIGRVRYAVVRGDVRGAEPIIQPPDPATRYTRGDATAEVTRPLLTVRDRAPEPAVTTEFDDLGMARLLRRDPWTWLGPLRAEDPARFVRLADQVWGRSHRYTAPADRSILLHPAFRDLPLDLPAGTRLTVAWAEAMRARGDLVRADRAVARLIDSPHPQFGWQLAASAPNARTDDVAHALARWVATAASPDAALEQIWADPTLAPLAPVARPPGLTEPP